MLWLSVPRFTRVRPSSCHCGLDLPCCREMTTTRLLLLLLLLLLSVGVEASVEGQEMERRTREVHLKGWRGREKER